MPSSLAIGDFSRATGLGVMVLVASLPGAVVLVVVWLRRARPPRRPEPLPGRIRVARQPEGAADI